jgi:hypothetical protein
MTADGLVDELPTGAILALCDKVLGEVGRRSHRFAWLRAPGAVADAWLPVEAYYPRHRLVVVCHSERTPYDHLFDQLVPKHGLRLLRFSPAALGPDLEVAEQVLRRMIARLPPPALPEHLQEAHDRSFRPRAKSTEGRASRSDGHARAPRLPSVALAGLAGVPTRRAVPSRSARAPREAAMTAPATAPEMARAARQVHGARPEPPSAMAIARDGTAPAQTVVRARSRRAGAGASAHPEIVAVGVAAGLALAAVCGVELIVAVIAVALDAGRVVLGLGIACDACARALGTLDSERVGKIGWAWGCAIVGSPVVVAAVFVWPRPRHPRRLSGRADVPVEAAPLAGLMAALALVFVLIGLVS